MGGYLETIRQLEAESQLWEGDKSDNSDESTGSPVAQQRYVPKYSAARGSDKDIAEIEHRPPVHTGAALPARADAMVEQLEREGVLLTYCSAVEDRVAFYMTDRDRRKVPPGWVSYSAAELQILFGVPEREWPPAYLKRIHLAKKLGAGPIIDVFPDATDDDHECPMPTARGPGRPKSIPRRLFVRALRLRLAGLGYQRIASELGRLGVATSRGSVERLVKGLPPYEDA